MDLVPGNRSEGVGKMHEKKRKANIIVSFRGHCCDNGGLFLPESLRSIQNRNVHLKAAGKSIYALVPTAHR